MLEKSVSQLAHKLTINIRKVDLMHTDTPEELKRWGSPTILVNGRDITGAAENDANCCRIYSGPGGLPEQQDVVSALELEFGK